MTIHSSHALAEEFPGQSEKIRELVLTDAKFSHAVQEYEKINHEILLIEREVEHASDEHLENLKKQRLHFLDEIQGKLLHPEHTGA